MEASAAGDLDRTTLNTDDDSFYVLPMDATHQPEMFTDPDYLTAHVGLFEHDTPPNDASSEQSDSLSSDADEDERTVTVH